MTWARHKALESQKTTKKKKKSSKLISAKLEASAHQKIP